MWPSSEVTIGRLRVQRVEGTDADPSRAAEMTIGSIDLRPASLPPGAILCVKSLRDPAPGTLRLGTRDATSAAAWRGSLERALATLASRAARPADGPVPAGAEAVLFRDDVELLACLAADWSQPGGRSNWWWRRLARAPTDGSVARAWQSAVPAIPAVIDRLARRRELRRALATIDDREILGLLRALAVAYGVTLPGSLDHRSPAGPAARPSASPRRPRVRSDAGDAPPAGGAPATLPVAAPWAGLEPDLSDLDRTRAVFAGVSLTLHRRAGHARSAGFAAALEAWLRPVPHRSPAEPRRQAAAGASLPLVAGEPPPAEAESPVARSRRQAASEAPPFAPLTGRRRQQAITQTAARLPGAPRLGGQPRAEPAAAAIAELPATPVQAGAIETRFGGVFFLLDLGLYLGLYGDFSQPEQPGIELDPWDFLTLLAGDFGLREELEADPLADLLRLLAGRDRQSRPGGDWDPGADWRIPAAWLAPFRAVRGPWRWSTAGRRLRVNHAAGFPVIDIPAPEQPSAAAVTRALRRSAGRPVLRRETLPPLRAAGSRPVDRWIARLGAYARARIRLALGPDAAPDLTALLLRLPATVATTPTTVDVEFELAALPIEVRIAGLDRDPGWIPAAHRTVRFHFR